MVASGFKAISLGLIALPASAGNPSLRGLASAEESTRASTLPSWCSNIPTSSWSEIPDCGGTTSGGSSDGSRPSWCASVPAESTLYIPACAHENSVAATNSSSSSGNMGVQLQTSQLPVIPAVHVPAVAPGVSPSVDVPPIDPNAIVQPITSNLPLPNIEASPSAERSTEMNLEASQLPSTPEIHVPAVVPGVTPSVDVPPVDPNAIVQPITSNLPLPNIGANPSAERSTNVNLEASQLPSTPEIHVPAVVPGVTPSVDVPSVNPNSIVQGQLPSTPEIHVPAVVPGVSPSVDVPSVNPNSIVQGQLPGTPSVNVDVGSDNTLLASSSIPAWCNDIPSNGQKYIAACGGGTESSSQDSNVGAAPSWCENIPAGSRANVPSCANQDSAPISIARGLASSTGLVVTAIAGFFSAVV